MFMFSVIQTDYQAEQIFIPHRDCTMSQLITSNNRKFHKKKSNKRKLLEPKPKNVWDSRYKSTAGGAGSSDCSSTVTRGGNLGGQRGRSPQSLRWGTAHAFVPPKEVKWEEPAYRHFAEAKLNDYRPVGTTRDLVYQDGGKPETL